MKTQNTTTDAFSETDKDIISKKIKALKNHIFTILSQDFSKQEGISHKLGLSSRVDLKCYN